MKQDSENKFKLALLAVAIFIAVFLVHFLYGIEQAPSDTHWSIYTAMSLIYQRDINLDEYQSVVNLNDNVAIYKKDGHVYGAYPIGASLVAVPVLIPTLFLLNRTGAGLMWRTPGRFQLDRQIPAGLEVLVASIIVALTAVFIYLIARRFLNKSRSLMLTFIFAFCTSAWSTASRALWQHGPSMLMIAITLYLILRAREKPRLIQYAGIPLVFSYVIRPTNIISVLLLSLYILIAFRSYFLRFLVGAYAVAIPFVIFNISVYGAILSPYYRNTQRGPGVSVFFEALAGNLVSPGRGLFVFTPVFLLAVLGLAWKVRLRKIERLDYFIAAIILLHWMAVSSTANWWGGYSVGPRYFTDMIPYFIYFLIPVLVFIPAVMTWKKQLLTGILVVLIALSFIINYSGAMFFQSNQWNFIPNDIDKHQGRLWDWHDIQFLRWTKG